ncbi:triosephosphate isomerase [Candidatus Woesebacteria bacterium]|nr:triosephosphate isomerase [Candidatus Woesebacteria bacterium]
MKKYIVANWKSNKNLSEAEQWLQEATLINASKETEVIIAPPFPLLGVLHTSTLFTEKKLQLAVQTISPYPAGSYTGAVSTRNLVGLDVSYALVGHSERRVHFKESDSDVARQVEQLIEVGIAPIVCVDEPSIISQASALRESDLSKVIVAFEPLSAIGTGSRADVGLVGRVRDKIHAVFGSVPVLYGGSVDGHNAGEYLLVCEGVLVGGASLDARSFREIIDRVE